MTVLAVTAIKELSKHYPALAGISLDEIRKITQDENSLEKVPSLTVEDFMGVTKTYPWKSLNTIGKCAIDSGLIKNPTLPAIKSLGIGYDSWTQLFQMVKAASRQHGPTNVRVANSGPKKQLEDAILEHKLRGVNYLVGQLTKIKFSTVAINADQLMAQYPCVIVNVDNFAEGLLKKVLQKVSIERENATKQLALLSEKMLDFAQFLLEMDGQIKQYETEINQKIEQRQFVDNVEGNIETLKNHLVRRLLYYVRDNQLNVNEESIKCDVGNEVLNVDNLLSPCPAEGIGDVFGDVLFVGGCGEHNPILVNAFSEVNDLVYNKLMIQYKRHEMIDVQNEQFKTLIESCALVRVVAAALIEQQMVDNKKKIKKLSKMNGDVGSKMEMFLLLANIVLGDYKQQNVWPEILGEWRSGEENKALNQLSQFVFPKSIELSKLIERMPEYSGIENVRKLCCFVFNKKNRELSQLLEALKGGLKRVTNDEIQCLKSVFKLDGKVWQGQSKKLAHKKYEEAYLEFLSHLMAACINYHLSQSGIGCYFDRRQSFGFLTPTVTDVGMGLRLNLGLIPNKFWLDDVTQGIEFFDRFLESINRQDVIDLVGETVFLDLFHSEKDGCGDLSGAGHWYILQFLIKNKVTRQQLVEELKLFESSCAKQLVDELSSLKVQSMSFNPMPDELWKLPEYSSISGSWVNNLLPDKYFNLLYDRITEVYHKAIKSMENADCSEWPIVYDANAKLLRLKKLMSLFREVSRRYVVSLENISDSSDSEHECGAVAQNGEPHEVIVVPKYLSSTGMSSLFLPLVAYYDVISAGHSNYNVQLLCVIDPYCYFEVSSFKRSVAKDKVLFISGTIPQNKDEGQRIVVYVDANACVNKMNVIPVAQKDIFNKYQRADMMVVDITSTTREQRVSIEQLWKNSKIPYLVFAESGLKHRQLGADLVSYGVNKLFVLHPKNKESQSLLERFSFLTRGESSIYATQVRHVLARACAEVMNGEYIPNEVAFNYSDDGSCDNDPSNSKGGDSNFNRFKFGDTKSDELIPERKSNGRGSQDESSPHSEDDAFQRPKSNNGWYSENEINGDPNSF